MWDAFWGGIAAAFVYDQAKAFAGYVGDTIATNAYIHSITGNGGGSW